jgi:hypothetical protein
MSYSDLSHLSPADRKRCLEACRGDYQRGIVLGSESLSGSTLTGKAASWGSHYKASRSNLVRRLEALPGIVVTEERRGKGRARILVLASALCSVTA